MKDLIEKSIYIGSENNDDGRNPKLKQFYYFVKGIKIENDDYTAKVVFIENDKGEFYYDQCLSTMEKGHFVDLIKKRPIYLTE